jgi:hypothetical protein
MGVSAGVIAGASLAVGAVSAGISAVGAMNTAKAQSENAAYQAQVAKNNQTIASQNAEFSIQAGNAKAQDEALKNRGSGRCCRDGRGRERSRCQQRDTD